jgi:hypothetical protein
MLSVVMLSAAMLNTLAPFREIDATLQPFPPALFGKSQDTQKLHSMIIIFLIAFIHSASIPGGGGLYYKTFCGSSFCRIVIGWSVCFPFSVTFTHLLLLFAGKAIAYLSGVPYNLAHKN